MTHACSDAKISNYILYICKDEDNVLML